MGGKMCPLNGWVENHAHVLKNCHFSIVVFDTVRWAFGLVTSGRRQVELTGQFQKNVSVILHKNHPNVESSLQQG